MSIEIKDVELATYISEVKGKPDSSHYYDEKGLLTIVFNDITKEEIDLWRHEYLNSPYYRWQNRLRGYIGLMKLGKKNQNH